MGSRFGKTNDRASLCYLLLKTVGSLQGSAWQLCLNLLTDVGVCIGVNS